MEVASAINFLSSLIYLKSNGLLYLVQQPTKSEHWESYHPYLKHEKTFSIYYFGTNSAKLLW